MHCHALSALLVLIINNVCFADDQLCAQRVQQYGQAYYCSYYASNCPVACNLQPTTKPPTTKPPTTNPPTTNPSTTASSSGGEPKSCATNAAQWGQSYYCSFYAAQCPITCGSGGGGSGGTCSNDYPKCSQMIQTYGAPTYCSYYAAQCPGPCKLPCNSGTT